MRAQPGSVQRVYPSTMLRLSSVLVGGLVAVPVLAALALLAVGTPITPSGAAYLAAAGLVAAGLLGAARWGRPGLYLALAGLLLAAAVAGTRLVLARRDDHAPLRVINLPKGSPAGGLSALVDEQDLLLFGEAMLLRLGGVSRQEHAGLAPALAASYRDLRAAQGVFRSPVIGTYLFLQRPGSFEAVVVEPEGGRQPRAGVIFLHGFMGNVALQCWRIAGAVQALGMVTVCPSTGWIGDWWQPAGQAIVEATLGYLRARGIERFYLGGFSNGGVGLSRLAAALSGQAEVRGLFFIAGVDQGRGLAATGRPVLVIQGAQDERMGAAPARRAVGEIGPAATYVELEADHFLIVKQPTQVQAALREWLAQLEPSRPE